MWRHQKSWEFPVLIFSGLRGTHRSRQPGEVQEGQRQGVAGLCDPEGDGVGEHEPGLGHQLQQAAAGGLLQWPGRPLGAAARQDVRLSQCFLL